jgi:hypothetical protein
VSAAFRPAEEIAREMVGAPEFDGGLWRAFLRDDVEPFLPLDGRQEEWAARSQQRDAIGFLVRLIEQSRAEGAAAERGRVPCSECGCAYRADAPSWCSCRDDAQQPRDLAGRIRTLLAEVMPEPVRAPDSTHWEGVKVKPGGKGLRLGLDWTRENSEARRAEAIDYLAAKIEAIVRDEVKP